MKKKVLTIFLLLVIVLTLLLTLVACGEQVHKHTLTAVKAVEPTCSEQGNSQYWYCSECNSYFSDAEGKIKIAKDSWILPAKGHTFEEVWSYDTIYHWHSSICEHIDVVGDKSEHTFVNGVCSVCQYMQGEQPKQYTIRFYANNRLIGTIQSCGNEALVAPKAPTISGYEFKGWYLDNNTWKIPFDGESYESIVITRDINVYARYDKIYLPPKEYTITFYADEQIVSTVQSSGHEVINVPVAPDKDYHKFVGWYLDNGVWEQEFDADSYLNTALTQNINVYAKYDAILYRVNFETDGGTPISPMNVYVIESSPVTSKKGYDFMGWYTDPSYKNKVDTFPYYPDGNITLYAKWESNELKPHYTINSNGIITAVDNLVYENTEVVIPEMVNGTIVRGLSLGLFSNNPNIVSLSMPDTVTTLEMSVCRNCPNLKEVRLSPNVQSIPEGMFTYCTKLTSITIPDSVKSIGNDAFWGTAITSLTLPSSVKSIGKYAFKDCKQLQSIVMNGVEIVGEGAFESCSKLSKVVFPDSITDISGAYMFKDCSSLNSITLPQHSVVLSYTFLTGSLYYKTPSNWDNGVLYVGNHLICVNTDFTASEYTVRASTVDIANNGLNPATTVGYTLKKVILPEGLKRIGDEAFSNNMSLEKVNIPSTVEYVGREIFDMTNINDNYVDNWLVSYSNLSGEVLTIKEGTVGIASGEIFGSNSIIKEVVLPSSLRYIGEDNFKNFSALTTVNLPAGLIKISDNAFNACVNLVNISMENCSNLEYIGETAFSWCSKITSFYIPKSVQFVGRSAFNQCKGVINVEAQEDEIANWHKEWFGTSGPALKINYGVSSTK